MPLNDKGKKIKRAMVAHYGPKKGERVFYASENAGKLGKVKRHKNYLKGSLPAYIGGSYNTYDANFAGGLGDPKSTTKYNWTGPNPHDLDPTKIDWGDLGATSAEHKRQMIGDYMTTGKLPGGKGGTTSVTTGGGGGDLSPEGQMKTLGGFGSGLLDPNSDMSKRWMEQMREEIGDQTDAAQRAAAYQAAQSGFGAGASPELLQMQSDLGVSGLEAAGDAASDFMLRAPTLGVQAMGTSLGAGVGMRGQDLQSKIASEANKLSREQMNAQLQMQQRSLDVQRELGLQDSAYGKELAALYSGVAGPRSSSHMGPRTYGGGGYGGYGGGGGVRGISLGHR